jgi:acetoin utilization protein AcuB
MTKRVVTVSPVATLQEAYEIMQSGHIRHLPVVEEDRLAGVITDRDLRLATSLLAPAPFAPQARVGDVMNRTVLTSDALDPVEDAARTMREHKIGCLPVLEEGRLAGIVTGIDLLDALLKLTGVTAPSGRLELRLPDRPGELARLTGLVSERNVNIHSLLTYPEERECVRTVLRVNTIETRPLASALREAGFDVVWPPGKPCPA